MVQYPFRLKRFLHSNPNVSVSLPLALGQSEQKPLIRDTAIAAYLNAIPSGNSVAVTAPATGPEAYYCPIYDPNSMLVGPGASWNGNIDTGETPPAFVYLNAQNLGPQANLITPWHQRFASDLVIGVRAEAPNGSPKGIASVTCHCEGSTTVQTVQSKHYFQDPNGVWVGYMAHWFTLDVSAFLALVPSRPASGYWAVNVWFEITANDGTFNVLQIGGNSTNSTTNFPNFAEIFRFYPDTSASDGTPYLVAQSGVGQSGATFDGVDYSGVTAPYATITAALNQARLDARLAPHVIVIQSASYNEPNGTTYLSNKGYATVDHAAGVLCEIGRPDAAAWLANLNWTPGWTGVHFRGSGIFFNHRFYGTFKAIGLTSPPPWFDGIVDGSTTNQRVELWPDKRYCTATTASGSSSAPTSFDGTYSYQYGGFFFTECTMQYTCGLSSLLVRGGDHAYMCEADFYDWTRAVIGVRNFDGSASGSQAAIPSVNVQYTGQPGDTAARLARGSGTLLMQVLDATHTSYNSPRLDGTFNFPGGQTTNNLTDVVAYINTLPNWAATLNAAVTPNDGLTDRNAELLAGPTTDCLNKLAVMSTTSGIHMDVYDLQPTLNTPRVRRLIVDNRFFGTVDVQHIFFSNQTQNIVWANNFLNGDTTISQTGLFLGVNLAVTHSSDGCALSLGGLKDANSKILNSVFSSQVLSTGVGTAYATPGNCHWAGGTFTAGTPAARSGDTGGSGTDAFTTVYPLQATYDTSPKGALLSNLVAPILPYDTIGATRQATDAKGARAVRLTSRTVTDAAAKTLAFDTIRNATGSNIAAMTLVWRNSAGDTGTTTTLTINVSVA